jgi:hypothetical protein
VDGAFANLWQRPLFIEMNKETKGTTSLCFSLSAKINGALTTMPWKEGPNFSFNPLVMRRMTVYFPLSPSFKPAGKPIFCKAL